MVTVVMNLFVLICLPLVICGNVGNGTSPTNEAYKGKDNSSEFWLSIGGKTLSSVIGTLLGLIITALVTYGCVKTYKTYKVVLKLKKRNVRASHDENDVELGCCYRHCDHCSPWWLLKVCCATCCCLCCCPVCCPTADVGQNSTNIGEETVLVPQNNPAAITYQESENIESTTRITKKEDLLLVIDHVTDTNYKDLYNTLLHKLPEIDDHDKFIFMCNRFCGGEYYHSYYCFIKECKENQHKFFGKCKGCCAEPIMYLLIFNWSEYVGNVRDVSSDLNQIQNANETVSYEHMLNFLLKDKDEEIKKQYGPMEKRGDNIAIVLVDFPENSRGLKESDKEPVEYFLNFVRASKICIGAKFYRSQQNETSAFNGHTVVRIEHPSESTNTGNATNLPINERSTHIPNTNNIEGTRSREEISPTSNVDVMDSSAGTSQEERTATNNPDDIDEGLFTPVLDGFDEQPGGNYRLFGSTTNEGLFSPVSDGFDEQDIENSSLLGSTTSVQSSRQDGVARSCEGMSTNVNDVDDEVTREMGRIKMLPLEELPGKFEIGRDLERGPVDIWIRSFPYTFMNDEGYEEKFDLNIENLVALNDAVNGGGNAALTFFAIFQMRKFDKQISYLRDILTKIEAKEDFINAIKILNKDEYNGAGKLIGNIASADITELATQTSGVAVNGSTIPQKTWEYIAGESDMQDVVKDCKLSRRRPGYKGKSEMLFEIIEQRCPEYTIEDMLKVFQTARIKKTVNLVNKKIQEKAERNITNDQFIYTFSLKV